MVDGITAMTAMTAMLGAIDPDARRRPPPRRRLIGRNTRAGVAIDWDAAAVFDPAPLPLERDGGDVGLVDRIAAMPRRALAAQARLGSAAVLRLIAGDAMNRA